MTHDVVENEPRAPSRGGRALAVMAAVGLGALVFTRLFATVDEPVDEQAAGSPPATTEQRAPTAPPQVRPEPGLPMASAPPVIRTIEVVAASRLALYHGSLDNAFGITTITGETAYATDDVTIHPYGGGVVIGPAPGASTAGPVRVFATPALPPSQLVAGIVPAIDGAGYWIMDTVRAANGGCLMQLVSTDGSVLGPPVVYPCDFVPERETAAGFVGRVGSRVDPASGRRLDRETGALTSIGGSLLGSSDRQVVRWSQDLSDPLVVEDLVSGDTADIMLPPGRVTRQVALSSDGRYLAVVLVERLVDVRSYEVWVHNLVNGDARVATITTLDASPLDLAWHGTVLVVLGNGVDAYDAATGELYRSTVEPMPSRLDAVALPTALP